MLGRLQKCELNGTLLKAELERIVRLILDRSKPRAVVLFGSAARDALTGASDLDLALVFDTVTEAELARASLLSPGPLSLWPVDLLLVAANEFQEKRNKGGVYAEIARGKVLYPSEWDWNAL